ncbi:MAG: PPOX class F420-dependent oxidoreductase [Acidobacteriota bacterium]|nr:PPOX class F420-dependent oxidoreductase [Acidobacteriota bacterium]
MTDAFTDAARSLFSTRALAHVATVGEDGAPYVTPVWVDLVGDEILINTALGRVKARHLASEPRVALSVCDPDDPNAVVAVRGTVTRFTTEGADADIDRLAKKYLGVERFEGGGEGEIRVSVYIRPDHISMQPED